MTMSRHSLLFCSKIRVSGASVRLLQQYLSLTLKLNGLYSNFCVNRLSYHVAIGWQVSHTNVRRPLISKRLISPLQFGQFAFSKILYFSRYPLFADCPSNTVTIAFRSTPMASRVLASLQIWSKVSRPIALPGVSGWTAWRHRISER